MKSFPWFPNGVCDPERLNSSRQNRSRQVSAGQAERAWGELPPGPHAVTVTEPQESPGARDQLEGGGPDQGQVRGGQWRGREGGRSIIGNLGQEFLKAKYLGLLTMLVAKTSLIHMLLYCTHP